VADETIDSIVLLKHYLDQIGLPATQQTEILGRVELIVVAVIREYRSEVRRIFSRVLDSEQP